MRVMLVETIHDWSINNTIEQLEQSGYDVIDVEYTGVRQYLIKYEESSIPLPEGTD